MDVAGTLSSAAWLVGSRRLRMAHGRQLEVPPAGRGAARYLSAIVRIPEPPRSRIAEVLGELAPVLGAAHHLYPPETVHLTLALLAERDPDGDGGGVDRVWLDRVRRRLAATAPFPVRLGGLNVSPGTVFVEARDGGRFLALRREVGALSHVDYAARTSRSLFGFVAHRMLYANVVRFGAPVTTDVLAAVRGHRGTDLGTARLAEAEIVWSDKLLSGPGTEVVEVVGFEGTP